MAVTILKKYIAHVDIKNNQVSKCRKNVQERQTRN